MRGWNVSCRRGEYSMLSYIPSLPDIIIIIIIIIIISSACLLGNSPLLPIPFFTLDRQKDALMFEAADLRNRVTEDTGCFYVIPVPLLFIQLMYCMALAILICLITNFIF